MQDKKKNISEVISRRRLRTRKLILKVTEIMNFNYREGKICYECFISIKQVKKSILKVTANTQFQLRECVPENISLK